ncbi:glycoside hydrolase family 2 [Cellulosimicrobium cellulans]|uniref:LamG-like jellyroll fold domain-containing protein n=1 Tax=Cellulosimicrobium cellulans TaxID=1710 RepID=UPI001EDC5415|nr:LamG-like jellyroll fold domain-containing protein [Cellulosimicrobium cellulans]UKJ63233.1 glycoside hydrolase family 2 [Cellulosimicrobium cellulans]
MTAVAPPRGRPARIVAAALAAALTVPLAVATAVGATAAPSATPTDEAGAQDVAAQDLALDNGLKGEYFLSGGPGWPLTDLKATIPDQRIEFPNLVPTFAELTGRGERTSARWTGQITPDYSEAYTFSAIGDNGFRLWIDDQLVIDHWVDDWDVEQTSAPVQLQAGQEYAFRMEMFQNTGGAHLRLRWQSPSQQREIVPTDAFTYPDDFVVFPAQAALESDGTSLNVTFQGAAGGVDESLVDHLKVQVDQLAWPVAQVAAQGDVLGITLAEPVDRDSTARLVYDGEGDLTVGGEKVGSLNLPVTNGSEFRIQTPWADDFDPTDPLPEYPRPQLTRDAWQNLNGVWQFEAAESDDAVPSGRDLDEEIVVPYAVESALSGIERREDDMFYRRTFEVPQDWAVGSDNRLRVNFGAVDYVATVYVNGTEVGTHRGGYEAFSVDVTDALVEGAEQELVVRAVDTTDGSNQAVGKQTLNPGGIFYTPTSGIWQTVWMEPVPTAAIDAVVTTPDVEAGVLAVTAQSASASDDAEVTAVVRDADGAEVGTATGAANELLAVEIPDAHLWSPEDPYLYDVEVTLSDGEGQTTSTDTVASYAGMRSIEVSEVDGVQRILLNGENTFLMSTLDQGYWPDGIYTPASDEAYVFDIQAHKDLGFNTLRKHIKVEPARFYYHADTLGLMIWQDIPSGWFNNGDTNPASRVFWEQEMKDIIDQHRSVPSIVGWVTFNEGWGEWNLADTARIGNTIDEYDPSRILNTHSGYNCCASKGDSTTGDIIDWHQYTGPALPKPDATRAAIDGEHGGFSMSVPGHMWPGVSANPYGGVANSEALTDAYVQNTEKLVRPAQCYLSGSVYTEISDVENELNGFWTYDRRVLKMDAARVKDVNERVIEAARQGSAPVDPGTPGLTGTGRWSFDEGQGTTAADGVGDHAASGTGEWVAGHDGTGSAIHLDGVDDHFVTEGPVVDTTGSYTISAWAQLDKTPGGAWSTIVGQDSSLGSSAFYLQYGGGGRWAFSYEGEPRAEYVVQPVLGDWYHVVGVRDAADQKLKLYVNGELVGQSDVCGGTTPSGPLTIGRGQWSGNPVDYWPGTIDDVRVFDRALSDAEVAQVYAGDDGEEPELDVTVTAQTRCLAGKVYVAVRATNGEDVPVDVTLATPFGTKAFSAVAPGANAYQSFAVRGTSVEAGEATVTASSTVDGEQVSTEVVAPYDATTCG